MRILYGVGGEGMGHATRSASVIEYLRSRGHTVLPCAGGRARNYLKRFGKVVPLKEIPIHYSRGSIAYTRTVLYIGLVSPWHLVPAHLRLHRAIKSFKPDVIVSDYEVFTSMAATLRGIPLIQANNISVIAHTKGAGERFSLYRLWPSVVDFLATGWPRKYVIPAIATPARKKKNVVLTPPTVRAAVRKLRPSSGEHLLVYQTSDTNEQLLASLKEAGVPCFVYGYGARKPDGCLRFLAFNEREFFRHLASARAVVLGGGFSLISEALYLKKPILSVPVKNHYEQQYNALTLERRGFGIANDTPSAADIKAFLRRIPAFEKRLRAYTFDPLAFAKTVEKECKAVIKR